jgi:hypothetical protein
MQGHEGAGVCPLPLLRHSTLRLPSRYPLGDPPMESRIAPFRGASWAGGSFPLIDSGGGFGLVQNARRIAATAAASHRMTSEHRYLRRLLVEAVADACMLSRLLSVE